MHGERLEDSETVVSEENPLVHVPQSELPQQNLPLAKPQGTSLLDAIRDCGIPQNMYTSLDISNPEERQKLMSYLMETHLTPDKATNRTFKIKHIINHPIQYPDNKTGEIVHSYKTIFITSDDKWITFVSSGIIKSLSVMILSKGMPPWNPPLEMMLILKPIGDGKHMYAFVPIVKENGSEINRTQ